MKNKLKLISLFKSTLLMLFLLLSVSVLSCNNPETQEQQNEMIHEEDEMPHDEHMMEEEMPHDDIMYEDTLHDEMIHEDTELLNGV